MGSRRKSGQELPVIPVIAVCVALIAILSLGIALCCRVIWDGSSKATETDSKNPSNQTGSRTPGNSSSSGSQNPAQTGQEQTGQGQASGQQSYPSVASDGVTPMFAPDSIEKIEEALDSDFLRLINNENPVGESYVPDSLTVVDNDLQTDTRISDISISFLQAARTAGYTDLYVCSAYRDYDWQYETYYGSVNNYIYQGYSQEEAEALTGREYSLPGASEHQYGMCIDIVTYSYVEEYGLTAGFDKTDCWKWIDANDYKYGFVLRYPEDKEEITGIMYEPWHYRYVGVEHAAFMKEHNMCLEEYVAFLQGRLKELGG